MFAMQKLLLGVKKLLLGSQKLLLGVKKLLLGSQKLLLGVKKRLLGSQKLLLDAKKRTSCERVQSGPPPRARRLLRALLGIRGVGKLEAVPRPDARFGDTQPSSAARSRSPS
jgi:hypothetical protein